MVKIKKFLLILTLVFSSLTVFSATPKYLDDSNLEVNRKLREAIIADKELSSSAQQITIVTEKNAIILQGHVDSKAKKIKIENLARARAGKMKVFNRITY